MQNRRSSDTGSYTGPADWHRSAHTGIASHLTALVHTNADANGAHTCSYAGRYAARPQAHTDAKRSDRNSHPNTC